MSNSLQPWTVAHQAALSMRFPKQEYWSGLPFPPPGDLPDPGIELVSPALAGGFFTTEPPGKPSSTSRWRVKKPSCPSSTLENPLIFGGKQKQKTSTPRGEAGNYLRLKIQAKVCSVRGKGRKIDPKPTTGRRWSLGAGAEILRKIHFWNSHRTCPRLKQKQDVRDPALTPVSLAPKSKLWEYPLGRGAGMLGWLKRWEWSRNTEKYRNTEKPSDTWSPL